MLDVFALCRERFSMDYSYRKYNYYAAISGVQLVPTEPPPFF